MPLVVTAVNEMPADVDVVAVPVYKGAMPPDLDAGELGAQGFEPELGRTARLGGGDRTRVVVGLGERDQLTLDGLRRAAAAVVRATWRDASVAFPLPPDDLDRFGGSEAVQAMAEGATLASYRFTQLKRDPKPSLLERFVVAGPDGDETSAALARAEAVTRAVTLARDLINTPPGRLTPPIFADRAVEVANEAGIGVEVIDEVAAAELGLGGLLGVGSGSDNPPRIVKLTYSPEGATASMALVGKGITFDSGGLSLKTGEGMMSMKSDMSGAAAVLGALSALPALAPSVKVTGYLCLAENMPSGKAIRPDDVLEIRNGTTVEVLNTDAEGRLVLADGLSLAAEEHPDAMIDLATLTGACKVALGPTIAGLMGNDDGWIGQVRAAADEVGESVWHLPLPANLRKGLESDVADVKNIGGKWGGALTAGLFLKEFVGDIPWVHLDIAGPAWVEEDDAYVPKGGTGFGVRTLLHVAATFEPPRR